MVIRGGFNSFSTQGFSFVFSQSLSKGVPSFRNGKYAAIEETIYIPCQRLKEHKTLIRALLNIPNSLVPVIKSDLENLKMQSPPLLEERAVN